MITDLPTDNHSLSALDKNKPSKIIGHIWLLSNINSKSCMISQKLSFLMTLSDL